MTDLPTITELEKLALKATPGQWVFDCGNGEVECRADALWRMPVVIRADILDRKEHCEYFELAVHPCDPDDDCEFVAAFNPVTAKALIADWKRMREALEWYEETSIIPMPTRRTAQSALAALEIKP